MSPYEGASHGADALLRSAALRGLPALRAAARLKLNRRPPRSPENAPPRAGAGPTP